MLKLFEQFKELYQVEYWLNENRINDYFINDDLTVDVNDDVYLIGKGLTEIPIQFGKVTGHFFCRDNKLTTLKGSPYYVGGSFYCDDNLLTSLEYCPKYIGYNLDVSYNKLSNLINDIEVIYGDIEISNNEYLPFEIISFFEKRSVRVLFDNQDNYGIWNSDGSLNKGRFEFLMNDYVKLYKREL